MNNKNFLYLITLILTASTISPLCGAQGRTATHEESKKEKAQEQQPKTIVLEEQEDSICQQLYVTLLSMPEELCRLIAKYACRGCMSLQKASDSVAQINKNAISCMAFLPGNKIVFPAKGSYNRQQNNISFPLCIFNIRQQKEEQRLLGHTCTILALATLHNNKIASGSMDKTIRIWDTKTAECTYIFSEHKEAVSALAELSEDSLASASYDGTIKIWNYKTSGKPQRTIDFDSETGAYLTQLIVLAPNTLLAIDSTKPLKVFNTGTGARLKSIPIALPITAVAKTQEGSVVLLLTEQDSQRQVLQQWDPMTSRCLDSRTIVHSENIFTKKNTMFSSQPITSLTTLPNNIIAFGRENGTIIFRDATTYEPRPNKIKAVYAKKECAPITFLATLSSDRLIASSSDGTTIWFL